MKHQLTSLSIRLFRDGWGDWCRGRKETTTPFPSAKKRPNTLARGIVNLLIVNNLPTGKLAHNKLNLTHSAMGKFPWEKLHKKTFQLSDMTNHFKPKQHNDPT